MVLTRRFRFYFFLFFCYRCFIDVWTFSLSTFGLSSTLLRHGIVRHLITVFYLCESNLNRRNIFDQSKISNYGSHYVEELEL